MFLQKKSGTRDLNNWMLGKLWVSCWMKLWISWRGSFSSSDSTARWQCRSFNRWTARICSRMTGQILTSTCFNKACCLVFFRNPWELWFVCFANVKKPLGAKKMRCNHFFWGVFVSPSQNYRRRWSFLECPQNHEMVEQEVSSCWLFWLQKFVADFFFVKLGLWSDRINTSIFQQAYQSHNCGGKCPHFRNPSWPFEAHIYPRDTCK